jgi:hypothetical protein
LVRGDRAAVKAGDRSTVTEINHAIVALVIMMGILKQARLYLMGLMTAE